METLVVVTQHKNQYYGRVKPPARFGSSPSRNFTDVNCRAFESGAEPGILPTPAKTLSAPITKLSASYISFPSSPKTPSASVDFNSQPFDKRTNSRTYVKSNPIAINIKTQKNERPFNEKFSSELETFSYSELWAGPAYSNSPPPSSLPMPKFSMRPKRTVSLDLPLTVDRCGIEMHHPIAKSAPASPTREHIGGTRDMFLSADSATKTLRRILNLDSAGE